MPHEAAISQVSITLTDVASQHVSELIFRILLVLVARLVSAITGCEVRREMELPAPSSDLTTDVFL